MTGTVVDNFDLVKELWDAAYNGDVPKLKNLIADPVLKDIINCKMNSQGHSALFFACYGAANAETVRLLISAGADPFQRDKNGCLPLHFAANSLDPELIIALLEVPNMSSIKFDAAPGTGQTPLHALFIPRPDDRAIARDKTADISRCLPFFLERDKNPLGALHKADNNGLSPLMLVKHLGLKASFYQYVPPKTFEILLKSVSVPSNIDEGLQSDLYSHVSFSEFADEPIAINERRRFRR